MNRVEHLLTITAEECNEVAQRISKALRFGLQEMQQGQPLNNAERIRYEMDDLLAMEKKLVEEGIIPPSDPEAVRLKEAKVEKYLDYSRKVGALIEG